MDELEEINLFTFNRLGNLLFKRVPEYQDLFDSKYEKTEFVIGGYLFMNTFSTHLIEKILNNSSSNFVINAIKFINELGNSKNLEVLNILKVGILELLYENKTVRDWIKQFLEPVVLGLFESFSKFYY